MAWYIVEPGRHDMVYGMALFAWHMVWPGGHHMV